MLNTARLLLTLQLFCAASPFASALPRPEDLDTKLGVVVHEYHLTARNLADALIRVASEFRLPIGIQWVNAASARAELSFSWNDATVRDIVEAIVKSQPGYSVEVSNGVLHVLSTDILPQQNFLLLRVDSFEVHHVVVEMAERKLQDLVRLNVAPTKAGGGIGGSLITNIGDPRIDVQINNGNVAGVLDSFVTGSSIKRIWVVTFLDTSVPTATGFRRTLTLWNRSPVPDTEQPVWNTFRWDEPMPLAGLEVR
jgi:hypothetical protein